MHVWFNPVIQLFILSFVQLRQKLSHMSRTHNVYRTRCSCISSSVGLSHQVENETKCVHELDYTDVTAYRVSVGLEGIWTSIGNTALAYVWRRPPRQCEFSAVHEFGNAQLITRRFMYFWNLHANITLGNEFAGCSTVAYRFRFCAMYYHNRQHIIVAAEHTTQHPHTKTEIEWKIFSQNHLR